MPRPRLAAARYLHRTLGREGDERLLDELLAPLTPGDRKLAHALIREVERHRRYLEFLAQDLVQRPLSGVQRYLVILLLLGLAQIHFFERIPDYAAVDETLRCLPQRLKKQKGFLNACLRNALRRRERRPPLPAAPPERRLGTAFSFPSWLVRLLLAAHGEAGTEGILSALNRQEVLSLSINTLKVEALALQERLRQAGIIYQLSPLFPDSLRVRRGDLDSLLPLLKDGLLYVQNESSRCAVALLQPKGGELIADVGAAPGGKTFLIQLAAGNQARVIGIDRDPKRLHLARENLLHLGIGNFQLEAADASRPFAPAESLDKAVVDPPCSSFGIIRQHPEIKWRHSLSSLEPFARTQLQFLESTAQALRPGGFMVYSVCTFTPQETRGVIESFLAKHPEFSRENEFSLLPHGLWKFIRGDGALLILPEESPLDGFFCCGLRKS